MAQQKQKQKGQHGGPRPKVRPDDRRGWNAVGGAHPYGESYDWNETDADAVKLYAVPLTFNELAKKIGISKKTLMRVYRAELDEALTKAHAEIGTKVYIQARNGFWPAQKYWLERRAGWNLKVELTGEDGGPIEHRDLTTLSDDDLHDLKRIIGRLAGMGDGESASGA